MHPGVREIGFLSFRIFFFLERNFYRASMFNERVVNSKNGKMALKIIYRDKDISINKLLLE